MNSKSLTVVLVVAILVLALSPQTEAFTIGAGGQFNGKRQLGSCEEVVHFVLTSVHYFTATYWN